MTVQELVDQLSRADPAATVYYLPYPASTRFDEVDGASIVRNDNAEWRAVDMEGEEIPPGSVLLFPP